MAALVSNCVCIFEETPSKWPISVEVTSLTETSPLPSDTRALAVVKFSILLKAMAADDLISAFTMLVIVLLSLSIALFVSVCESSKSTSVASVTAVWNCAKVPETVLLPNAIVLLVKVSLDVSVTTAPSVAIVISLPFKEVVIPEPPKSVNPPPNGTLTAVELSSAIVTVEFDNDVFPILDKVLFDPEIVLFVNVWLEVNKAIADVFDKSVEAIVILPDPSNDWPAIVLAFAKVVAVSAFPVTLPCKFATNVPVEIVKSPVVEPVN